MHRKENDGNKHLRFWDHIGQDGKTVLATPADWASESQGNSDVSSLEGL